MWGSIFSLNYACEGAPCPRYIGWVCTRLWWKKIVFAFGWKYFLLSISWFSIPFLKLLGCQKGISVRSKLGLILMKKDFNFFNFYGIEIHEIF